MNTIDEKGNNFSTIQSTLLAVLRMVIGWHFLYEGVSKILIPDWSAGAYLQSSRWIFAGLFHWMASNAFVLQIVDFINMWGLTLVGLGLLLGLFTRVWAIAGIGFLALFYLANPPFVGTTFGIPQEGHYLLINKNLVEMAALAIVAVFPSGLFFGLDRFVQYFSLKDNLNNLQTQMTPKHKQPVKPSYLNMDRREVMKNLVTLPILGGFVYGVIKKYNWEKVNAITGATIKVSDSKLKDLKGELPMGKIGDQEISRLIMGGNLIGGWSHSRDLIYVSSLFKAYNTEKKVFETLELAEMAGINTMNITHSQFPLINKYKTVMGGKIKTISQIHPTAEDIYSHVDKVIDNGVDLIQIQGNCCDWRVKEGNIDVLAKCIDYIRKQGYPAGLGAHSVQALIACDETGLVPDFYMKTLHHDRYWSAHPMEKRIPFSVDGKRSINHDEFHDNMFCLFPDKTVEFINSKNIPVIGFKVLAGGAIQPDDGFRFAFENGADFICVGMFDYQIVDDVNTAVDVLDNIPNRTRKWWA